MSQMPTPFPKREVSVGNWMWTMIVMSIPVLSFIMCFVWAFNPSVVESKRNYFKAILIWKLIFIGLTVLAVLIFVAFGISLSDYIPRL